jgi:DNA-binding CsgD family transcriptional regulator
MSPAESQLTLTEASITRLVADGWTNQEIAASLAIRPKTVQGHLASAYHKLGIRSRTELALLLASSPATRPPTDVTKDAHAGASPRRAAREDVDFQ